jgi:hypothetical protein
MEKNKFTEGLTQLPDGRFRLVEKNIKINKASLVKKEILKEKTNAIAELNGLPVYNTYEVKLWKKIGFNKNERNYSRVFNKVLQEKELVTLSMIDHVEGEEESYRNVVGVCFEPHMIVDENGEEWLGCYITHCGKPWGENAEAILSANGYLSYSSVCDGNVDSNGYVEEEGFTIYRFCDLVTNPSNGWIMFSNKEEPKPETKKIGNTLYDEDPEEKSEEVVQEEQITESVDLKKDLTIYNTEKKEDNSMETKLLEKILASNINALIKDADKTESLEEKKLILTNALTEATDLSDASIKDKIVMKLAEADKAILDLAEKGKKVDSLEESVSTLSTAKTTLEGDIDKIKKDKEDIEARLSTITEMYEKKQYKSSLEETQEYASIKKELASTKKMLHEAKSQLTIAQSRSKLIERKALIKEAISNTKVDADLVVSLKEDIDMLTQEVLKLRETNKKLRGARIAEKKEVTPLRKPSRLEALLQERRNKMVERKNVDKKEEVKEVDTDVSVDNIIEKNGYI